MRLELLKRAQKIADEYATSNLENFFIIAKTDEEEDAKCLEKVEEFGDNIIVNVLRLYGKP